MKKLFLIIGLFASLISFGQQQTINVGTGPNDHTGDPLRDAFIKVNHNFNELYSGAAGGTYTGSTPSTITVGGLPAGSDLATKTFSQILQSILVPYIQPSFLSFLITGQATVVETGTTLTGSKPYAWSVAVGSGTVPTIDIYDNTAAATLLAGTANDGTQSQTITTIQLNSDGATQSWKGIGNNTAPSGTFNSSNFVVTSRYFLWYAPVSASLTNSASVRALANSSFATSGSLTLNTGTSLTKFVIALPPSKTLVSVVDLDALSADITSAFIAQSNINVLDAGSTNRSYSIFEYNVSSAYTSNHRLVFTYN